MAKQLTLLLVAVIGLVVVGAGSAEVNTTASTLVVTNIKDNVPGVQTPSPDDPPSTTIPTIPPTNTTTPAPGQNSTTTTTTPTTITTSTTTVTPPTNATTTATTSTTSATSTTTTTISPVPTSNTTTPKAPSSTSVPPPEPSKGGWGWGAFFAGIVFTAGIASVAYIVFRFYKARTDSNYHTL